jgi:hypothetical protein
MTTRDAGLTQEQVEAAEVHAAGSSHCGEIKGKSAFSRYSTEVVFWVPFPILSRQGGAARVFPSPSNEPASGFVPARSWLPAMACVSAACVWGS